MARLPTAFVSHGSPMLALDTGPYAQALRRWAAPLKPRAIVVVSAHWESRGGLFVTAAARPETVHDFGGFPRALHEIVYPAPGEPALARALADRLSAAGRNASAHPTRGLDHGAWVPLRLAFPEANVPVVELSLARELGPRGLLDLGRVLAPLRDEGVLLLGSGGIVHNLAELDWSDRGPIDPRAQAFDAWFAQGLEKLDVDALCGFPEHAPEAHFAVPTPEHLMPAFVVLGARQPEDRVETLYEGFQLGSLSLRSFALRAG